MTVAREAARSVTAHIKDLLRFDGEVAVSREKFRGELFRLGLLGSRFGASEYLEACRSALGIRIIVEEVRDYGQAWGEDLVRAGHFAELLYDGERRTATILVRESLRRLPWPAYELALYHELSHLMARHFLRTHPESYAGLDSASTPVGNVRRPARAGHHFAKDSQDPKTEGLESEARVRARWLLLAGRFPEAFLATESDRFP